ncbi:secondary thiamine-phosphate synthase enzyme YjbQ [Anaerosalibacter massiliensis]|uniref:Secondary thiamine-phosphate synthase enzyme YjbQ n=1 Tax=Anaerosalibacter massiliensis TaxID=1347392 RepID=A0A9X2S4J0_9FIRM|nr:secondary thiamine-phosphate synthase enzyme YjbQ [Anaerosalibacter massiliensis]MCR2043319.1 secondary thiamine-phosphate synthase enzyme YjbQ [Anaerosalibacter massiliensis]
MLEEIGINTNRRVEFIEITNSIQKIVTKSDIKEGICYLFVPHTTAGLTINENADPTVLEDMIMELNKIIPFDDNYEHLEGNSAAHIKSSLIGVNQMIIIEKGKLKLGTWQGVYFTEFDGPRNRKLYVKIVEDKDSFYK